MELLSTAAQLGEAVGGAAAVVGVVFALVSVKRWRRDRLAERRAEAAGRAYVALSRACDLLAVWAESCSKLLAGSRSTQPFAGAGVLTFRSHHEWRDSHTREAVKDARTEAGSATVYLDDDEVRLLLEVEPLYEDLRTWAGPVAAGSEMPSDTIIDALVTQFDGLAGRAQELKRRGELLREVARFGTKGK